MYKLHFLVPEVHAESVKAACFKAGAGKIGHYQKCAWQILGTGQYEPIKGSNPYQGTVGKLETAREYMIEMVIEDNLVKPVVQALLEAHPYETPVYGVWKILTIDDLTD